MASKLVVLRGLEKGNVFWSIYQEGDDPTLLADGTVAYEVIAYPATDEEAVRISEQHDSDII